MNKIKYFRIKSVKDISMLVQRKDIIYSYLEPKMFLSDYQKWHILNKKEVKIYDNVLENNISNMSTFDEKMKIIQYGRKTNKLMNYNLKLITQYLLDDEVDDADKEYQKH